MRERERKIETLLQTIVRNDRNESKEFSKPTKYGKHTVKPPIRDSLDKANSHQGKGFGRTK